MNPDNPSFRTPEAIKREEEFHEKFAIALWALEYIVSKEQFVGQPKWDAEFVDVAKRALRKIEEV